MGLAIKHNTKISTTTFLIITFFFLILLSSLNSNSDVLQPVGYFSVIFTLTLALFLFFIHFLMQKDIHKIQFSVLIVSSAFLILMLLGLFNAHTTRSFITIYQFITVISFFLLCSLIEWDTYKIKIAKRLSMIFIITLPLIADIGFIGPHIAFALFFLLLDKKKSIIKYILICFCLYLIYQAGMRGVYLLILSAGITYMLWNFISKNKFRFVLTFITIITGSLSFIFIYPKLKYWDKFYVFSDFVFAYTGKRLMSGRDRVWELLLDKIDLKPLLGYGTGIYPVDLIGIDLSAHNLFLQITMQNGFFGLTLLIALLFVVWMALFKSKSTYSTRLSASFFIGILIYQSFEVVLIQNKMDTALMFWFVISVGVSSSMFNVKKQAT